MSDAIRHPTRRSCVGHVPLSTTSLARFETDAAAIGDADLDREVDFAQALLALMRTGAPQGTLVGT